MPPPPPPSPGAPFGQQVPHADANAVHEGSGDDAPAGGHRGRVPTVTRRGPAPAHGRGVPRPPMDAQRLCPGARGRRVGRVDGNQPAGGEVDRRVHGGWHVGGGGGGGGCGGGGSGGGRGGGSVSSSVGHRDGRRSPLGAVAFVAPGVVRTRQTSCGGGASGCGRAHAVPLMISPPSPASPAGSDDGRGPVDPAPHEGTTTGAPSFDSGGGAPPRLTSLTPGLFPSTCRDGAISMPFPPAAQFRPVADAASTMAAVTSGSCATAAAVSPPSPTAPNSLHSAPGVTPQSRSIEVAHELQCGDADLAKHR